MYITRRGGMVGAQRGVSLEKKSYWAAAALIQVRGEVDGDVSRWRRSGDALQGALPKTSGGAGGVEVEEVEDHPVPQVHVAHLDRGLSDVGW